MSDHCKPIGFFDSGVGGISVLKTAFQLMPCENYIYYGDNINAPYGEKTEGEIKALSLAAGRFLYEKGVKAIVMACNTATSAAVMMMREEFNIPVISMEPAVKPALSEIRNGKILVLATPATIAQERYLTLLKRLDATDKVINIGCEGLADLIEEGQIDSKTIFSYLTEKLSGLSGIQIDSVVIGCTHYSFIENEIKDFLLHTYHIDCKIFDGRHGTVRQLSRVLDKNDIRCCKNTLSGSIEYFSSGNDHHIEIFKTLFNNFKS
ncbi:MAG: glutamate racemase [Christensenellales bacterium]|jgi:glutamate racemase